MSLRKQIIAIVSVCCFLAGTVSASAARADVITSTDATAQQTIDYAAYAGMSVTAEQPMDTELQSSEGKYAAPLVSGEGWHGFFRGGGRDITINLGDDHPIGFISIEMMQDPGAGIYYPSHLEFQGYVSGRWVSLGTVPSRIHLSDRLTTTQMFSIGCHDLNMHLIRIHFPVDVWVFARQIHVLGHQGANPGRQILPRTAMALPADEGPMKVADPNDYGIQNMLLAYSGDQAAWTKLDFLPMVSYIRKDGTTGGRMFDTVLFLPYPSLPDSLTGWKSYIDNLFLPGTQLDALDQAMAQEYPGSRENVVLSLPYPRFGDGIWGSINGEVESFSGSSADPEALEARTAALEWAMEELLTRFHSAGYQHLQLTGFYWFNEFVDDASPGEEALIHNAVSLVHAKNLPILWIPSYDASGISNWKGIGFDAAWMQPNFVWAGADADVSRLTNTGLLASMYNLGVQIELPAALIDPLYRRLYLQSIQVFAQQGLGSGVSHAFYTGDKDMVTAANSSDPDIRALYDITYQFISGTH